MKTSIYGINVCGVNICVCSSRLLAVTIRRNTAKNNPNVRVMKVSFEEICDGKVS